MWRQFGAAIDMLENALLACPDELWGDRSQRPEFWYLVYHTLFWLDLYLSGSVEGFAPPVPFTLDELDPAGLLPERVYRKDELLRYLEHGRRKCRAALEALTDERAREPRRLPWRELSVADERRGAAALQPAPRPAPCRAAQSHPPAADRFRPALGRPGEERAGRRETMTRFDDTRSVPATDAAEGAPASGSVPRS